MNVETYLNQAWMLKRAGTHRSNGCSFVGWFVHRFWPELEQACWAHDYARVGLIEVDDQRENDNLFKDALKYLGAPRLLRTPMYWFTRLQGYFKDKFGITADSFIGIMFTFGLVIAIIYSMVTE
jgi:hypothetical protein